MYNGIFAGEFFDVRFVPDDIYYCYIDLFYNDVRAAKSLDDKNLYDLLFPDVTKPETLARKIDNIFYDKKYILSDLNTVVDLCMQIGGVIVKPAIDSEGGHGIEIWEKDQGSENLFYRSWLGIVSAWHFGSIASRTGPSAWRII